MRGPIICVRGGPTVTFLLSLMRGGRILIPSTTVSGPSSISYKRVMDAQKIRHIAHNIRLV